MSSTQIDGHVATGDHDQPGDPVRHVAFCIDNRYFRAMGATIMSLIDHNPGMRFHFHVLAFAVDRKHQERLASLQQRFGVSAQIHLIDAAQFTQFEHFTRSTYYSPSIFTRLLIPDVLRGIAEKVLYLDADILCTGPIRELMQTDLGDDIALVVPDAEATTRRRVAALQIRSGNYFNSGVMLINVPRWIEAGITAATIAAILKDGAQYRFPDQDALNVVLDGRARFIDRKWNYLHGLVGDLERGNFRMQDIGDSRLVHFAGSVKPWSTWTLHDSTRLFARHHAAGPWADMPMDEAPQNYKEMRMHARFLKQRGEWLQSLRWFFRYLKARPRK